MPWELETAAFLSLAPPRQVWLALDRMSLRRFKAAAVAKQKLIGLETSELQRYVSRGLMLERELLYDSSRYLQGRTLERQHGKWLPRSGKIAIVLQQLPQHERYATLSRFHPDFAEILGGRMQQRWLLSPQALQSLRRQAGLRQEALRHFSHHDPDGVAAWLAQRFLFPTAEIDFLCEILPVKTPKGPTLTEYSVRHPGLNRLQQAAVTVMSLPPEISKHLFQCLDRAELEKLTLAISRLRVTSVTAQRRAIRDIMSMSLEELEEKARQDPAGVAERLRRWL